MSNGNGSKNPKLEHFFFETVANGSALLPCESVEQAELWFKQAEPYFNKKGFEITIIRRKELNSYRVEYIMN